MATLGAPVLAPIGHAEDAVPAVDADSTPPDTSIPLESRQRLLAEWTRDGADNLDAVLGLARGELVRGQTELWPALLDYLRGVLSKEVDLLLLQVLDVQVSDETKVRILDILGHHLRGESWTLIAEVRGRNITLAGTGRSWRAEWGPLAKDDGPFVTVEDVYQIRDAVMAVVRDVGESERVRQHGRELLALIALKDAEMWRQRSRVRVLRGDFNHLGEEERMRVSARSRETSELIVAEKRNIWEEEKARTAAIDANRESRELLAPGRQICNGAVTGTPSPATGHRQKEGQEEGKSAVSPWQFATFGLVGGAAGMWLLLRRRRCRSADPAGGGDSGGGAGRGELE